MKTYLFLLCLIPLETLCCSVTASKIDRLFNERIEGHPVIFTPLSHDRLNELVQGLSQLNPTRRRKLAALAVYGNHIGILKNILPSNKPAQRKWLQRFFNMRCSNIGELPIHIAARHSDTAILRLLLERGANPNGHAEPPNLRSPARDLARYTSKIEESETAIDTFSECSYSLPLIEASRNNSVEAALLLLNAGARVNQPDRFGRTALHAAAYHAAAYKDTRGDLINLLVAHGADIEARDGSDLTPLWEAALAFQTQKRGETFMEPNWKAVRILCRLGANVNQVRRFSQDSLLHQHICPRFLLFLLMHGANPDARDAYGYTPLAKHLEESNRDPSHTAACYVLLQHGAQQDDLYGQKQKCSLKERVLELEELYESHDRLYWHRAYRGKSLQKALSIQSEPWKYPSKWSKLIHTLWIAGKLDTKS